MQSEWNETYYVLQKIRTTSGIKQHRAINDFIRIVWDGEHPYSESQVKFVSSLIAKGIENTQDKNWADNKLFLLLALNHNKKLYFDYQIIKRTKVKNVRDISHDFDYAWMQLTDTVSSAARYALHLAQAVGDPCLTPEQTLKAARKLSKVLRRNIGDTPATQYAVISKNIFGLADMNTAIAFERFPDFSEQKAIMQVISEIRRFPKYPTQRRKIRSGGSWECEGLHTLTRPKATPFAKPEQDL